MSGVIEHNGEPVPNARVVRTVDFSGAEADETMTDEHGFFELPEIFKRTAKKYLPQEFVASQKVVVHFEDTEHRIWYAIKRVPEENSESRGKPLDVKCELTSEESIIMVNRSPIHSLCTWDVEPDEEDDIPIFDND
ncbi:MAG: carboxypeptidase regulatory-like domain-containing protein [Gammaproteobacteria bacterium]|nr:carboxypeptidase regulatory-like domain-containing protein [Gammaproteobacteria bacterium]